MFPFHRESSASTSSSVTATGTSETTTSVGQSGDDEGNSGRGSVMSGAALKINSKGKAKERYLEIDTDNVFRYLYKRGDASPQGTVDLTRANFVRTFDHAPDCRIFELQDGTTEKVLMFECSSHEAARSWVDAIDVIIRKARVLRKLASGADPDQGSARIAVYEQEGLAMFAKFIQQEMQPLYVSHASFNPGAAADAAARKKKRAKGKRDTKGMDEEGDGNGEDEDEDESLVMACLNVATDLTSYLEEVVAEVQAHASPAEAKSAVNNAAKHALVLAASCEINRILSVLFAPVTEPSALVMQNPVLGDVHALITWLTKYQKRLKAVTSLYPPPPSQTIGSSLTKAQLQKQAGSAELFARLPALCELYVYGACGDSVTGTGAANNLLDYCLKIWAAVARSPAESLQQRKGGSFHTQAPVDIWRILHQHISLASLTESQLLHVLVAERVAAALNRLVIEMITALEAYDTHAPGDREGYSGSGKSGAASAAAAAATDTATAESLQESETEFVCAVANDVALHIENVLELVSAFTNGDIRRRIDEAFQSVVVNLVRCGQACLQRLVNLILQDTRDEFAQISAVHADWVLHGRPAGIIAATLRDYLSDLLSFLSPLWTEKFMALLFDAATSRYVASLLSLDAAPTPSTSSFAASPYGSGKRDSGYPRDFALQQRMQRVDADTALLLQLFTKYLSAQQARNCLDILREASRMLTMPVKELVQFCSERVREHPFMAEAVYQVAAACVRVREACAGEDKAALGAMQATRSVLQDALESATRRLTQTPASRSASSPSTANPTAPVYSRLELRYNDLVLEQADKASASTSNAGAFERMQDLASASLSSMHAAITTRATLFLDRESVAERGNIFLRSSSFSSPTSPAGSSPSKLLPRHSLTPASASASFVQDVLEVLYQSEKATEDGHGEAVRGKGDWNMGQASAPAPARQLEPVVNIDATVLFRNLGPGLGMVVVPAPALATFQQRFAKLSTRRAVVDNDPTSLGGSGGSKYIYTLFLYRKLGSSVLESLDAGRVRSLRITCCSRALAFCLDDDCLCVASSSSSELAVAVEWDDEEEEAGAGGAEVRDGVIRAALGNLGGLLSAMSVGTSADHGFGFAALLDPPAQGHSDTFPGGEKELRLRSVDHLVKWVNALASIAGLSYDPSSRGWTHTAQIERTDRIAQARASISRERQEAAALDMIKAAKAEVRGRSNSNTNTSNNDSNSGSTNTNSTTSSSASSAETRTKAASAVPPDKRGGVVNIANPLIAKKLEWEEQARKREREKEKDKERERVREREREREKALAEQADKERQKKAKKGVRFQEDTSAEPASSSPLKSKRHVKASPNPTPVPEPEQRQKSFSGWLFGR